MRCFEIERHVFDAVQHAESLGVFRHGLRNEWKNRLVQTQRVADLCLHDRRGRCVVGENGDEGVTLADRRLDLRVEVCAALLIVFRK